ncbi:TPA: hypothetical protein ACMDQC_002619 [Vibrio parahaemolyticus]|nr:hypothetical protein [Vibrio parahaemolyticus]EGR1726877.1 hypothetical protein [Vibrio parahaemolyticus]
MDLYLNPISHSSNKINLGNIEIIAMDYMSKINNLRYIAKNSNNLDSVTVYAVGDIYRDKNFLSSDFTTKELIKAIQDDDARKTLLSNFVGFNGIINIPEGLDDNSTLSETYNIYGFNHFIISSNNPKFISFDVPDCGVDATISDVIINNTSYENIPSFLINDELIGFDNTLKFIVNSYKNHGFETFEFDWFYNYGAFKMFLNHNESNYKKLTKYLVENQDELIKTNSIIGDAFATINNFNYDHAKTNKVNKGVKRRVYSHISKGNRLISLDFRHLEFEKHDLKGKHLGVVTMFTQKSSPPEDGHDLKGL